MRNLITNPGRRALALMALVTAGAILAGVGDARSAALRRVTRGKDKPARTLSGRVQTPPMTLLEGVLSRDSSGQWRLDGTPVRPEEQMTLVAQGDPGQARLTEGRRACLMGYLRGGVFVAYSGILLTPPELEQPALDVPPESVVWSEEDPGVGTARPDVPK